MITQMKKYRDYKMIPIYGKDYWEVKILTGKFKNTIFAYDTLDFTNGDYLFFTYTIIDSPILHLRTSDDELTLVVREILIDILDTVAYERNHTKPWMRNRRR